MHVIPSRADGEGPHKRSRVHKLSAMTFGTLIFVDRESGFAQLALRL